MCQSVQGHLRVPASGGVISAAKPQMDREPLRSSMAFLLEYLRTALAHHVWCSHRGQPQDLKPMLIELSPQVAAEER